MHGRNTEILRFGPFEFRAGRGLSKDGADVPLPPRALAVLTALLADRGDVVSKADLLEAGWRESFVSDASLTEAIRVLRVALDDRTRGSVYVQTVHRRGYRFIAPVTVESVALSDRVAAAPVVDAARKAEVYGATSTPAVAGSLDTGGPWRPIVRGVAAGMAFVLVSALSALVTFESRGRPAARLSVTLPAGVRVDALQGSVAVAADGSRLAFIAGADGRTRLFVRDVASYEAREILGSDGARDPFFSPDGRRLGFFAGGRLSTVAVDGSDLRVVAAVSGGAGATWMPDDSIVFGGAGGGGLARTSSRGGPALPMTAPAAASADVRFGWPEALPAGDGVLFTVVTPAGADLAVTDGLGGYTVVARDTRFGRFTSHRRLVAERDGHLVSVDVARTGRAVTGKFTATVTDVASVGVLGGPRFAAAASGALVYVPGVATGPQRLRWLGDPHSVEPDALADVLVLDRDTPADARLATSGDGGTPTAVAVQPTWRPDGLAVAFALNKSGPFNLFVRPRAGGEARPLGDSPWNQTPTSWSPDGGTLLFTEYHPASGADVWAFDLATGSRRPVAQTADDETGARFSPDGRWLAYLAHGPVGWDVVVRPSVGGGAVRIPAVRLLPGALGPASAGRELRVILPTARDVA